MKKVICMLLCAIVLFVLCSCNNKQPSENAVKFYYRNIETQYNTEDGVLSYEYRDSSYTDNLPKLISEYLDGPANDNLVSPFPKGSICCDTITTNITCEESWIQQKNDRKVALAGLIEGAC